MSELHPTAARFVEAARAAGLDPQVREFPQGTKTAADAARAVGCDVAQIVKTLVFVAGERVVIGMVSGAHRLDPAKLAAAAGAPDARPATPDEARAATGFAIGGTPPLGYPSPLPMFVDRALLAHDEVWVAAGTPASVWPVAPPDLVRATGAVEADLAE